jgi:hypothetical protein
MEVVTQSCHIDKVDAGNQTVYVTFRYSDNTTWSTVFKGLDFSDADSLQEAIRQQVKGPNHEEDQIQFL